MRRLELLSKIAEAYSCLLYTSGDMTGGNIGAAGLNAALKQQAVLTELSDNMDS